MSNKQDLVRHLTGTVNHCVSYGDHPRKEVREGRITEEKFAEWLRFLYENVPTIIDHRWDGWLNYLYLNHPTIRAMLDHAMDIYRRPSDREKPCTVRMVDDTSFLESMIAACRKAAEIIPWREEESYLKDIADNIERFVVTREHRWNPRR
jgi:hypothetical protein